jgi:CDP-glucose 4,6-dehydratase
VAIGEGSLEGVDVNMNWTDSFRGRSIFITGHTGFKGSWLTLWLNRLGARVSGYSLPPPTSPSNFASSGVGDLLVRESIADVRDHTRLQTALEVCQPDLVFHLAAQTIVRQSFIDARDTIEINVMGTANVLEAVRLQRHPCAVIIVTSDKCYDNRGEGRSHSESDPLGGPDPYSASKASAEIVTEAYRSSFFPPDDLSTHEVKVATARAGNCFGGGDWAADRIVPDAVRALAAGESIKVRNPHSIRPWQHVLQPLSGYLLLASRLLTSDDPQLCSGWNFGPRTGEGKRVEDLIEEFLRCWGRGGWECVSLADQPREDSALRLCIEKARLELGWEPRWTFQESIRSTARWYKYFCAHPERSTRDLCLEDIREYERAAADESDSSQPALQVARHG